jgi:maleate cis-trans isomerase
MAFKSWRGTVGMIKPTRRPGSLEELIRMLPEGIGVIPLFLSINQGTTDEFKRAVEPFIPLLDELAEEEVDLMHPEGAPPFMLLGFDGEAELIKKWEKRYNTPIFTSGTNHVTALRALKAKKIVGATYFTGEINNMFGNYFKEAGFDVLAMEGIDQPFDKIGQLSSEQVYAHVKEIALRYPEADAVYLLGSGWRVLPVIDILEQDLGIPVVHPVPARCWEIQKRLNVHQPVEGFGYLLAEMVDMD